VFLSTRCLLALFPTCDPCPFLICLCFSMLVCVCVRVRVLSMFCLLALFALIHCASLLFVLRASLLYAFVRLCCHAACWCSSPSASSFIRVVMHVALYIVSVVSRSAAVQCVLLFSSSSSDPVFFLLHANRWPIPSHVLLILHTSRGTFFIVCTLTPHPISLYPFPFFICP